MHSESCSREDTETLMCKHIESINNIRAIKVTKDLNVTNLESFEHEVKILRSLRHPNIVLFMGVALNVSQLEDSHKIG